MSSYFEPPQVGVVEAAASSAPSVLIREGKKMGTIRKLKRSIEENNLIPIIFVPGRFSDIINKEGIDLSMFDTAAIIADDKIYTTMKDTIFKKTDTRVKTGKIK